MARAWQEGGPLAAQLQSWLTLRLAPACRAWLESQAEAAAAGDRRSLHAAFSRAARVIPRDDLRLSANEAAAAAALVPGFDARDWTLDQAARTWLLLNVPAEDASVHADLLDPLFRAADLREHIALCRSLPLLPHPAAYLAHAQEAVRSNMTSVFNALVLRNPYPATHFAEPVWNQMVLKALFIGAPLDQIIGLPARANPRLSRMLVAYARERRAARRLVPPALWRASAPYLDRCDVDAVQLALASADADERQAAAEAIAASPALLRHVPTAALAPARPH